jgi:MFS family permease
VVNSTLASSLPSGAIDYIGPYFNVTSDQELVLPISLFLVGYVLGPLFFGPLSETFGRRIIMLASFVVFTIFTMACALAPSWPAFLIFRLICGINASSAIAVVGGLYADVFGDPVIRGRAMAIFMAVSQRRLTKLPCADCSS